MVYVLNSDGSPLMPCTEAKARHLIESGKAKVVRRTPFIIRLAFLFEGEVNTESATLGVDAGSSVIGDGRQGPVRGGGGDQAGRPTEHGGEAVEAEWQAEPQDPLP